MLDLNHKEFETNTGLIATLDLKYLNEMHKQVQGCIYPPSSRDLMYILGGAVHLKDIKEFPLTFWLTALTTTAYYLAVFLFVSLGP